MTDMVHDMLVQQDQQQPPRSHTPEESMSDNACNNPCHLQKLEYSADVLAAMNALKEAGAIPKWGSAAASGTLSRRNVFMGELKQMGIKNPDRMAIPSVRNDAAFLTSVVGEDLHWNGPTRQCLC